MAIHKILTDEHRGQRGITILELLIAVTITSILTTAMYQLYLTQHENYMIQDDITNIQQNTRASLNEIGRQVRMAGYELPLGLSAIVPSNSDPDTITITYKAGSCDTYLSANMPQPSSELKCAGDVSCFYDGQWVFIYEGDAASGEWFEITHVQPAAGHLQHNTMSLSKKYSEDAIILAMTSVKYYVDNTTDPDHPMLMMEQMGQTPQVYAEDISDLQITYQMKSGSIEDEPIFPDNIREVMISVEGRSSNPDPDNYEDPYRERIFSTSVNPRNITD